MPQNAFNVRLNGKLIDTVFDSEKDPAEVKRSLVNHDGYDSRIVVTKEPKRTPKSMLAPSQQETAPVGPVPHYDPKEWSSYEQFLVFNNID